MDNSETLIQDDSILAFRRIVSDLPDDRARVLGDIISEILSLDRNGNAVGVGNELNGIFLEKTANYSLNDQVVLKKALVAKMALDLPSVVEKMDLPKSVLELYPDTFGRLVDELGRDMDNSLHTIDNYLLKGIHFTFGLSVPCGAQTVDMISTIKARSLLHSILRTAGLGVVFRYLRAGGHGSWFRIHTDINNLTDFHEKGWDACYLRIAELLECREDIRGMVGTSWFYDPQLLEISPRLAYLQKRPLERGAFALSHRTSPFDIESATMKSKTRRRLFEEKRYNPKVYSIVWPRQALIDWAKEIRQNNRDETKGTHRTHAAAVEQSN